MISGKRNNLPRWALLIAVVLLCIIVPFLLFGRDIELWTRATLDDSRQHPVFTAVLLGGLLALDILLPVPSSLVSTACGLTLGFVPGTLVSLAGMVISCAGGYGLGRWCGQPVVRRWLGESEQARLQAMSRKYGDWIVILARPIPVLAEASVLFVGMGRMSASRFFLYSTLANLGVSAAYAAIGAFAANVNSFLLALAGSLLLPWLMMMLARRRAA